MRLIVTAATTAAALSLLVTACKSTSASSSSTSLPSASTASASPAANTSGGGSGGGPLASLTADQIASKANANLKAAASFHLYERSTINGSTETEDLTGRSGECKGTYSIGGTTVTFVLIAKTLWVEVNKDGTYLKGSTTNTQYQTMIKACTPALTAGLVDQAPGLTKRTTTVIDGQSVLQLSDASASIYVTNSATPEYVRVDVLGLERMDFSDINAPVSISPPPASEVLGV